MCPQKGNYLGHAGLNMIQQILNEKFVAIMRTCLLMYP